MNNVIRAGDTFLLGDPTYRGYAKYDISSIPVGSLIYSITLETWTTVDSWSDGHRLYIKGLNIDPGHSSESSIYGAIGAGGTFSSASTAMVDESPPARYVVLNTTAIYELEEKVKTNGEWWAIGFQEDGDDDDYGEFRGANENSPKCTIIYEPPPEISLVFPNGGESLPNGTQQTITWDLKGNGNRILVYKVINNTSTQLASLNWGATSYSWRINESASDLCKIKVVADWAGQDVEDYSDDYFSIFNDIQIELVAPTGGEIWYNGSWETIIWSKSGVSPVDHYKVMLYQEDYFFMDIGYQASDTSYSWHVNTQNSDKYKIKIAACNIYNEEIAEDLSPDFFTITSSVPVITMFIVDGQNSNMHVNKNHIVFNWDFQDERGLDQKYYHILVSSNRDWNDVDMWDSGLVESANLGTEYFGKPLHPDSTYYSWLQIYNDFAQSDTVTMPFGINSAPYLLLPDTVMAEDSLLSISLDPYLTDSDDHDSTLSIEQINKSTVNGAINDGNSAISFIPPENWYGNAVLIFKVEDTWGLSSKDTVQITVLSVNDLPSFPDLPDSISFAFGSARYLDVWAGVEDVETDDSLLVYSFINSDNQLNLEYDEKKGMLTVQSKIDSTMESSFIIRVEDEHQGLSEKNVITNISSLNSIEKDNFLGRPYKYFLYQNYPNPFNPITTINYTLQNNCNVKLTVFDVSGREVKKLVNQNQNSGRYSVLFDASNLASGIYIYKLQAGSFEQSRKLILIR
jgi:hypothetical protein